MHVLTSWGMGTLVVGYDLSCALGVLFVVSVSE